MHLSSKNIITKKSTESLPAKLIVGYANWNQCDDKLIKAVEDGVNVLIWFSINLSSATSDTGEIVPAITGGPDMDCVADMITRMRDKHLHVVHLISVGGWNSPHPDTRHSTLDTFSAWHKWNTETIARPDSGFNGFDGLDWDIEGNDTPTSPYNTFSVECLDLIGQFSRLAKQHGYIVAMAPAESYLDPTTSLFDRSLLHKYPEWNHLQPPFAYHGHNTYAYILSRYEKQSDDSEVDTFDFITVQLYEGYSHACHAIEVRKIPVEQYLEQLVGLFARGWRVDFSSDKGIAYESKIVSVRPAKLVIGLANGWAGDGKFLFIRPEDVGTAYLHLASLRKAPRGFAFWNILDEGRASPRAPAENVWMAMGLRAFMMKNMMGEDVVRDDL